jgi:LmbE family N-acetylglucosaminyl deacetylase
MTFVSKCCGVLILGLLVPVAVWSQMPRLVPGADERFKVDILVVVAHPDDEGGATPYLARAIYDLHKRVGVVYGTSGGSGGNDDSREHGNALANIREIEAREACSKLGITNVWFLNGKDTASQNVMNSLANWGHGENLERLVGIFRLTRPEVVITWLPGVFIGENHGDHQASGVLATEAFDLSADPEIFPAQVAGASKRLEPYLENLGPWQAKKIYYFSDARDDKQFAGKGPSYSIKGISPSQKKPYWRLALDAATAHKTQFPKDIEQILKASDEQIEKMMSDPNTGWWTDPETLIFGKSEVQAAATDDIFAGINPGPLPVGIHPATYKEPARAHGDKISIGGPWFYYAYFRAKHQLAIPVAEQPEIAVKAGTVVEIPLHVDHADPLIPMNLTLSMDAPKGWKVIVGQGQFTLPAEAATELRLEMETPSPTSEEFKTSPSEQLVVKGAVNGKSIGEVRLRVLLRESGLPQ